MTFLKEGDFDLFKFLLEIKYQNQQSAGELIDSFNTHSWTFGGGQVINTGKWRLYLPMQDISCLLDQMMAMRHRELHL